MNDQRTSDVDDRAMRLLARCGATAATVSLTYDGGGSTSFGFSGSALADVQFAVPFPRGVAHARLWGTHVDVAHARDVVGLVAAAAPEPASASQEEVLLRAIFQTSQVAIGVSKVGIHELVNPSYAALFGFDSPEQAVGRPILDVIAPEEHPRIRDYVQRRARGVAPPATYVTRGRRRDGTTFDLAVSGASYVFRDEVYTLVLLRDVTVERQAREALTRGREFYRAMFEVNTAIKLLIEPTDGSIVDANVAAAEFYGYSLEELKRRRISDINVSTPNQITANMERARAGTQQQFTFQHQRADGAIRHVEVYTGPLDIDGRRLLLSIIHDVTDRQILEEQLRLAQKMEAIGRLAGGVSHDFNNLLTLIIGYGEQLVETVGDGTARRDAERLVEAAHRARELIAQLLTFGGRQAQHARVVSVDDVVRDTETLLARLVGDDVVLSLQLGAPSRCVRADPVQLQQVLMNLCVNARDAMPNGGRAEISTREHDGFVELTVRDEGVGMDAATRARVFEPFFTTKPRPQGTGLGLATVYGIVEQSGGQVDVESAPGHGATFRIRLPMLPEEQAPPSPIASAAPSPTPPATILLVEDDHEIRVFFRTRLEMDGHTVHEAADGASALALSDAIPGDIDLVLTDVSMPGMTGPQLVAALRERRPKISVILASGWSDDHLPRHPGEVFLQKPFSGRRLLEAVAAILASRGSRD